MEAVNSLAALKRYFKAGGRIQLVEYLYHGRPTNHKNLLVERKPEIVQTNSVMFEGGSWLDYGKAADWEFVVDYDGIHAINDCEFCKLDYRLMDC